jgi:hypothetical protein
MVLQSHVTEQIPVTFSERTIIHVLARLVIFCRQETRKTTKFSEGDK